MENKDLLANVSLFKPSLSDIYTTEYADFMSVFSSTAIPDYLKNTFFIEGGSLAVENALKVAFDWKEFDVCLLSPFHSTSIFGT